MTDRTAYRAVLATIALERFAWYLMLGCLVLWRNPQAVGNLLFAGYLLPLLGGVVGRYSLRASVLTGCLISLAGYIAASANLSALALPLLALGCGLFKPCLSALLGGMFSQGPERSRAFGRYYAAIQVGSMPSTLVGGYLHYRYGWGAAFGAAALALGLASTVVLTNWRRLQPARESLAEAVIDGAIVRPQWGRLVVLMVGAVLFFAGFQQQSTTLVLWARDVCRVDLPETVSTLNPVFALALLASPVAAWSSMRGRLVAGMLCLASGFAALLAGSGLWLLIGWYALATVGEVLVSPLGLELACSLVPRRLAATATALWLLSMAGGGKLAGVLGTLDGQTAVRVSVGMSLAGALWFALALTSRAEWYALWTWIRGPEENESMRRARNHRGLGG